MNKQPVLYYQTDRRWADVDYSAKGESTTIGRSGCGPTCMAMVIATWVDKNVTPVEACAWALSHGYKAVNQGTYYSYFKSHGAVYGIRAEQLNGSNLRNLSAKAAAPYHEKAARAIRNGDLVICCMGPGLWTSGGHFILLWDIEGDTAYINDPASSRTARTRGSLARLRREVKYYFVCRRPEGKPEKEQEEDDVVRYKYLKEIPNDCGFRDIVDKLMTAGIIGGDGSDPTGNGDVIDLSHDMVRQLVFEYRGGAFDRRLMAEGLEPVVEG